MPNFAFEISNIPPIIREPVPLSDDAVELLPNEYDLHDLSAMRKAIRAEAGRIALEKDVIVNLDDIVTSSNEAIENTWRVGRGNAEQDEDKREPTGVYIDYEPRGVTQQEATSDDTAAATEVVGWIKVRVGDNKRGWQVDERPDDADVAEISLPNATHSDEEDLESLEDFSDLLPPEVQRDINAQKARQTGRGLQIITELADGGVGYFTDDKGKEVEMRFAARKPGLTTDMTSLVA